MSDLDPARRLGLLLGPPGPELTCEQCFEHLDRYVELELAGRDADAVVVGMRAHLEGCPACFSDLYGRFSADDQTMTATEVNSYRLTSGEPVTYRWDWQATRRR